VDKRDGESEKEEVMGEGIGESEMEELTPEWGWRRDKGSWFQRQGETPLIIFCILTISRTVSRSL